MGLTIQSSRAVGHANGQNPVAIVVPCHRVIGADATLTGYAGGLDRKRWLLEHEGITLKAEQPKRDERQLSLLG
jgi:methylated-DNA-[protein]-cysteine S-methyltransferase